MAFRLTNKEEKERQALAAELGEKAEALTEARDNYNEVVERAIAFRDGVAERLQSDFDNKSEGWQEGDKGSAAQELISAWEELEIEKVEFDDPEDEERLEEVSTEAEE